ncbi:hypothetical protein ACRAWF_25830 [Streptomyces sp. L7]
MGFAYEDHYLVTVRPHVMNPLHPTLRSADGEAGKSGCVLAPPRLASPRPWT